MKPRISGRKLRVEAPDLHHIAKMKECIRKMTPVLRFTDEGIAIIGEWERNRPSASKVINDTEWEAGQRRFRLI
jgi:hypothetical protein